MHTPKYFRIIRLAYTTADAAHRSVGQVRNGSGAPYITHLSRVARLVRDAGGDHAMILAAYLHDTVKDTPMTLEDVAEAFGDDVATLVASVTGISSLTDGTRAQRKAMDQTHYADGSARAQTVKLADILDNLSDLSTLPAKFIPVYLDEEHSLVKVLTKGNPELRRRVITLIIDYYQQQESAHANG
jgi:(p)ppGpp synthase/HD superfamily hydrolase